MISSPPDAPPLEIYLLGLVDFEEVQQLQRRLVYDLGDRGGASLVLCEHPPTISVGRDRRAGFASTPTTPSSEAMGIKVHWVNRGEAAILHLPGQLAAYFTCSPWQPSGLNLQRYLDRLARGDRRGARRIRPAGDLPPRRLRRLSGRGAGRERGRGCQPLDRLPRVDGERRALPELFRADRRAGPRARTLLLLWRVGRSGRRRWRRRRRPPHPMSQVRKR